MNKSFPKAIDSGVIIVTDATPLIHDRLVREINTNGGGAKKGCAIIPTTNDSEELALSRAQESEAYGEGMIVTVWHIGLKGGFWHRAIGKDIAASERDIPMGELSRADQFIFCPEHIQVGWIPIARLWKRNTIRQGNVEIIER